MTPRFLVVYSGNRPPEHHSYLDDQSAVEKYLTWVESGVCRVFKWYRGDYYELDAVVQDFVYVKEVQ